MLIKKEDDRMNNQPKIYFAYGSNLNLEDMKVRCPTARLLGAGRAKGHELMFRGHTPDTSFLTVVPSPDRFVPIAAFEVYEEDIRALDDYEDVQDNIYRTETMTFSIEGHGEVEGFWYVMNGGDKLPPTQRYWDTVVQGYQDFHFDVKLLEEALTR